MPNAFSKLDHKFMLRALTLARRAQGKVEPNPMVGAVLTTNDQTNPVLISEGYHRAFGGPHAEAHAILNAGGKTQNTTLYVTLEPCCHWGKTPPCTDMILRTGRGGITRVVIAMEDPFPKVAGGGIKLLRKNNIQVDVGLLEAEAKSLNAPFISRLTENRPFVIAKWAQSLDGVTALVTGESQWISSEISRASVQKIRGRMDGILVGINTALTDNPLLMARPAKGSDIKRIATRIILDSECRLPLTSQLVKTIPFAPVLLVHNKNLSPVAARRLKALTTKGVMSLALPTDKNNRPQLPALLKHLAQNDYTNVLLEGGPTLMAAFIRQKLVDEAHIFLAPLIIGGQNPHHAITGPDLKKLAHANRFTFTTINPSGPDLHIIAHPAQL